MGSTQNNLLISKYLGISGLIFWADRVGQNFFFSFLMISQRRNANEEQQLVWIHPKAQKKTLFSFHVHPILSQSHNLG